MSSPEKTTVSSILTTNDHINRKIEPEPNVQIRILDHIGEGGSKAWSGEVALALSGAERLGLKD